MKNSKVYRSALFILAVFFLTACATVPGTELTDQESKPVPTESSDRESKPELVEKSIYVGPTLVDCVGVGPQECMLIKETPKDEYSLFIDQIVGFDYEEGYEYKLVIKEEPVENPPADSSSLKWSLVRVDSKTPVVASEMGSLENRSWALESYLNLEGVLTERLENSEITADFQDGQLIGNAGCNNYFASYQVDGSNLTIGSLASTEMYCMDPPALMDQEITYLAVLESAMSYQLVEDRLIILDAEGQIILTFNPAENKSLTGTLRKVLMYNNGKEAVVSVILGTEITAFFYEDGKVRGTAGCNNYSTSYELNGEKITIGSARITRMVCAEPEGIMEQEMQYLAALEMASSYQFEGDNLILMDSDGRRVVDYQTARSFALSETVWHLQAYINGAEAIASTLNGTDLTVIFNPDGSIDGFAGCNNFLGTYVAEGEKMSIELGSQTLKLCEEPEGVMDQETAYLVTLQSATNYQILGDVLIVINDAGQEVLNFQASDLIGYVWMWLEFLENNDTRTAPDDPENYTIQFHPDGQVELRADCNHALGTYILDGNRIDIEILITTLAACPSGSLSDEYIRLLNDAVIYFREGDFLYLDIKFDTGTMKFLQ
jgi:heat shock protein HslJ